MAYRTYDTDNEIMAFNNGTNVGSKIIGDVNFGNAIGGDWKKMVAANGSEGSHVISDKIQGCVGPPL